MSTFLALHHVNINENKLENNAYIEWQVEDKVKVRAGLSSMSSATQAVSTPNIITINYIVGLSDQANSRTISVYSMSGAVFIYEP